MSASGEKRKLPQAGKEEEEDDEGHREGGASGGDANNGGASPYFVYNPPCDVPMDVTHVRVHESIAEIPRETFMDRTQLEEVILPEEGRLRHIGASSFEGCTALRRIDGPPSLEEIDDSAFYGCTQLGEVDLPNGLRRLGYGAFGHCSALRRVDIPPNIKEICNGTFDECTQLGEVNLPNGLREIGAAFEKCSALKRVDLPSSTEEIIDNAFKGCRKLAQVNLPTSMKWVGEYAFADCTCLMSVELRGGVSLYECTFGRCTSLRNLALPPEFAVQLDFRGCHDLVRLFGARAAINDALKNRFEGCPVHKLCYSHSSCPTGTSMSKLCHEVEAASIGRDHDRLGMTPLHILTCSAKHNVELYRIVFDQNPKGLITEDKWECVPIFYAIWGNAPEEIIEFLVAKHVSFFPSHPLAWDKMITTLCRAGVSLKVISRLLKVHHEAFPEDHIDWHTAAKEIIIWCMVTSIGELDISSCWAEVTEMLMEQNTELARFLPRAKNDLFPQNEEWQRACEQLTHPLQGWWRGQTKESAETFLFIVKCDIPERLPSIGVKRWRLDIVRMIDSTASIQEIDLFNHFFNHLDRIHTRMTMYESEYQKLEDVTSILELALWKLKMDEIQVGHPGSEDLDTDIKKLRVQCRISSGVEVILPSIVPYLIPNVGVDANGPRSSSGKS